ncbi:Pectinesterase 2 [Camellia lanceoleosa]|uniref:Pectinesterase 2 n=1 Tax=Camellia lanceoleosa TaxID=1840588 RepID=A0ACC0IQ29_9ERIC|nr:Pectinesterase 2 [Camellia lanceoleosa]
MSLKLLISLISLSLLLSPAISGHHHTVKKWCGKTPYAQPCEYFLTNNPKYIKPIKHMTDFFKLSVQLALDRALHAQTHTYKLGSMCRNEREKEAWADCLELYEYTIHRLNKTVYPTTKKSKDDIQTWLSTALTNLETCREGFEELGVADHVYPLMSNNVSRLISNTLAMNKVPYHAPSYKKGGFPSWVKPGDRKLLQTASSPASIANVVVAQDGSGNFKTIGQAVAAAAKGGVQAVVGDGFIAQGVTIRNTAGAVQQQAVALRVGSDLSVFYQCSFEAYQDTLYVHSLRQFFRECDIYGTVDFIFGNSAVVFQNCNIYARSPPNKTNTLTAQGRTDPNQNTGISIHNCKVTAASDLVPVQSTVNTYLGRPWKMYSRTVFMNTFLDSLINPAGWMPWTGNFALSTLYYGEYMNTGPGSSTAGRVKWPGYHVITSATVASQFTVGSFISGNSWLPTTKVPFTPGL